jgi:hypothetical protein
MTNQIVTDRGWPDLRPMVVSFTVEFLEYLVRSIIESPLAPTGGFET